MKEIYAFYKENIESYTRRSEDLKRKMHLIGSVRLLLVAAAITCIWIFREESWGFLITTGGLFAIPFAALMFRHNRLSVKKSYIERLMSLNENELKGLDYDFSAFDGGTEFSSPEHSFSLDLDLFGDRSIFQSVNRTVTNMGREVLSGWFRFPLSAKEEILKRQEAVRELTTLSALRQHFYVTGINQQGNRKDRLFLQSLANGEVYFIKSIIWKLLIWVIPAIWIVLLAGMVMGYISGGILGFYLTFCFLIAYLRAKQVNDLYNSVNKMEKIFSVYADLMESIEVTSFQSGELKEIAGRLSGQGNITASRAINQLSEHIGGLDQRFSAAGMLLNLFYLRDTRHAMLLEQWKEKHREDVVCWLDALGRFDALSSLGGFGFNHPGSVYPEISDTYFRMEGKGLSHPLLHRDVCVKNDIDIRKSPWFLIITGANMAGKSTYLRTVGVNYLLACMGAPVCADSLVVYPARLVTSLRTSDSLVSNESYFFAELKRLKMIIDRLKAGEKLFIILDEILKGTNSIDKQKGSIALMKQLVTYKACGIIATHDLVLGTLEEEFPDEIKNYRFEADIKEDELSFSYLLREGIAQNMNAYFLMKKMGITL